MPRTRSLAWSELKIGLLAILALAIATTVIFLLSGEGGFFWQRYKLRAKFDNVATLKSGAPVRVAGVEVGSVSDMTFDGAQVDVTFELSEEMRPRVTDQSMAYIGAVSLLGEGALDITPATEGTPLAPGSYIKTKRTPGQLSDVAESATRSLEEANRLLQDIRAGKGTVGRLFTDDQLYKEVTDFVAAAEAVADNLRRGRGTLGKLVSDPSIHDALEASLTNLQDITTRLNNGEGSLGRLLHDEAFSTSLASTTANLDEVTGRLKRGEGTAGKLLTEDALYERLDSIGGRVDELTRKLNAGEGTAGRLLNDQQLYENLNSAATELRGLVADIRKDPQKYLRVKVSIF
jgi:phospholipid/cholesterol/gamma-HCH transport system substrate-binding protein